MNRQEFYQYFSNDIDGHPSLEVKPMFHRTNYQGFYKCTLCGLPHRNGFRYTIGEDEAIICPSCHQRFFYQKKYSRNLAEWKKNKGLF